MREKWIDAVKALAILFVLLGHAGVHIPFVSSFAVLFYVPVFFVLAGYLYRERPGESYAGYVRRRAVRLLVPYFGYSLFLWIAAVVKDYFTGQFLAARAGRSLAGILFAVNTALPVESIEAAYEPLLNVWNAPLWFLPALFLAEVLFAGLQRLAKGKKSVVLWGCVWCLVFGILAHYMLPVRLPWSADTVPVFEVFLVSGWQLGRLRRAEETKQVLSAAERAAGRFLVSEKEGVSLWAAAAAALSAGIIRWKNGPLNVSLGIWGRSLAGGVTACLLASVSVMLVCFACRRHIPEGLALLGQHTMTVLGLHLFSFLFLQAGIGRIVPEFPEGDTILCEVCRIGMVILTMDILTLGSAAAAAERKGRKLWRRL